MKPPKLVLAFLILSVAACNHSPKADPAKPESYAVSLPLEPAREGGSLQRLALPAAALVALKRPDLGDVRLFDARDKLVPLALLGDQTKTAQHRTSVPVYPVVGPAGALESSGLYIRIEDNRIAKVVTVNSAASPATNVFAAAALLDTRALREPVVSIELDADLPANQPITLTLLTSANLKDWEPLTEKVMFRASGGAAPIGGERVELPGVDLRNRYVGISWGSASGFALKNASVTTSASVPPTRIAIATSPVPVVGAHDMRFELPNIARLTAMRVIETGPDGVIPVKLYGRRYSEEPWTPLSAATLRPGSNGSMLDLASSTMTSYRLEADGRTAGFSSAPKLELLVEPVELLVAFSGMPPYRLAVGNADALPNFLTSTEIVGQIGDGAFASLPQAKFAGPEPVVTLQAGPADGLLEPRKLVLWAALLLGTFVLGFAAIRLLRATKSGAQANDR
jgi:hypothetical protein